MKVMKFGGTSVGSPQRIKNVAEIITKDKGNFVVLSAMSGTTNSLVEICDYINRTNYEGVKETISKMESLYRRHIDSLLSSEKYRKCALDYVLGVFSLIRNLSTQVFSQIQEKIIVGQGELISTHLMFYYLQEQGVNVKLLAALDFMKTDPYGEPDQEYIKEKLNAILEAESGASLYLTQGFICRNTHDEVDNLQRGGSDYSASLIGAAIGAEEIQIWTDIDGMHNNDPRVVEGTKAVRHLHFDEAAELAYFGAKILHPTCIQPAKFANIPVLLLNTMDPSAPGTVINNVLDPGTIKAVAVKDSITAIRIKSSRMLLAHGFLRKVFEIFESYQTPIDMISTSEVSVSLSIDKTTHLTGIIRDL